MAVCLLLAPLQGSLAASGVGAPEYTLACVGDVMLGRGVAQALDGDWGSAFAEARPWLAGADLACGNLESPLTTAAQLSNGYDLRALPEAAHALAAAGFDVVSLANNHGLDAGPKGLSETLAALQRVGIVGMPAIFDVGSRQAQVAWLAFDDTLAPLDRSAAERAVAAAARSADLVVVSIHWGGEYQSAPSERQRAVAEWLTQSGADLIIGHGPHVVQPVEHIGGGWVAYSLGNFLFDAPYPADLCWGAILQVQVRAGRVIGISALPTVTEHGRVRIAGATERNHILTRLGLAATSERRTLDTEVH